MLPGSGISDYVTASITPQIQTARLSLNYRFGDGKVDPIDNSTQPVTGSWTGPYLGIGGGYSAANNELTFADRSPVPGSIFTADVNGIGSDGGFLSFTGGYDYQINWKFVVGAFADADFSNARHSDSLNVSVDDLSLSGTIYSRLHDIIMVGGRLGYLSTSDTLLFASAGYANAGFGDTNISVSIDDSGDAVLIDGKRFSGFFVGGGVETKINDALSLKAEYRYIDLASENMTTAAGDQRCSVDEIRPDGANGARLDKLSLRRSRGTRRTLEIGKDGQRISPHQKRDRGRTAPARLVPIWAAPAQAASEPSCPGSRST